MNKKARRAALCSALSYLYKSNKLTVVDKFEQTNISTKSFVSTMTTLNQSKSLVIISSDNVNLQLSARNVKDVKVLKSEWLNIYDILKYNHIIFTQDAVRKVEGALQS